jgi:hypothetical protein
MRRPSSCRGIPLDFRVHYERALKDRGEQGAIPCAGGIAEGHSQPSKYFREKGVDATPGVSVSRKRAYSSPMLMSISSGSRESDHSDSGVSLVLACFRS